MNLENILFSSAKMNTGNDDENIFMIINHSESNSDDDESYYRYKKNKNQSLALDLVENVVEEPEPVVEESVVEVVEEPVVESVVEVAEEPVVEPVVEVVEVVVEPVAEVAEVVEAVEAVEVVVEPVVETVVEPVVEPVVEVVVETVVEPVVEVVEETVVEPVVEVVEVVVEPEPVVEVVEVMEIEEPQNINQDTNIMSIPKIIFVVPYRDREHQLSFFDDHMRNRVLVDYQKGEYLILYAHQIDTRDFNRGAMKNIGFIAGKNMFPDNYKEITFVFNDVDTMPYVKNFLHYQTTKGNVKHFYGYEFALGGIVSITGEDFEKTNGYPNLFAWSCEDNELQRRVLAAGLNIDRSKFYPIMDKHILQNKDGLIRVANRTEHDRIFHGTTEGMSDILEKGDLRYDYNSETGFVNVLNFSVRFEKDASADKEHDVRKGTKVFEYVPLNMIRNSNLKKAKYWGISKLNMKLG